VPEHPQHRRPGRGREGDHAGPEPARAGWPARLGGGAEGNYPAVEVVVLSGFGRWSNPEDFREPSGFSRLMGEMSYLLTHWIFGQPIDRKELPCTRLDQLFPEGFSSYLIYHCEYHHSAKRRATIQVVGERNPGNDCQ
jgi:hypothetical protein